MYFYYLGITDSNKIHSFTLDGQYDDAIIDNFTDAEGAGNYNYVNDRFNHRINTNFIKRFVKEEVSYSVGVDLTYISRSGNDDIADVIKYNFAHWDEDADANLCKNMLIYSISYELYYINSQGEFCSKVISPRHGWAYTDDYGNVIFFLHIFRNQFDTKMYIDIYTDSEIIHCDEVFNEVADRQVNIFGQVPIGIAQVSDEGWLDSLYNDIKSLQDSYEINLSDISQEITEFRNAYLAFNNCQVNMDDLPEMKKKGVLQFKGDGSAQWLIKTINDTFVQNTLKTIEEKMFQLSAHINPNEKMQSNTSSLSIRARLLSLEEKCKLNQKALANCIKTRIKMLFSYLNSLKNMGYDYKDIKIKFTPNVPSDDLIMSQIISQLGDKISTQTAIAQLSFIDNPKEEMRKIQAEQETLNVGNALLDNARQKTDSSSGS